MKEYGHPAMFPEKLAERVIKLMLLSGGTIKWRGKFSDLDNFGTETDSMESKIVRLMQTE